MGEWHEHDQFWDDCGGYIFREQIVRTTSEEIDGVIALLRPAPGAAVLDMPCGTGRHSIELARRGFRVTGVDRTAAYLQTARARAERERLPVEWVQSDMRKFVRPGAFDMCTNLYTSFGYFEDQADDRQVAANMFGSLRPGGQVLFEMAGKEILARRFTASDWHEESDGTIVLEQRSLSRDWTWIENRWLFIRGENRREVRFSHRLYGAAELKSLLAQVGFVDIRAFGSLAGTAYDQDAKRLVVIGRRPG